MPSKLTILHDYCVLALQMENLVNILREPWCQKDVTIKRIQEINHILSEMEDAHPWLANALIDIEGT